MAKNSFITYLKKISSLLFLFLSTARLEWSNLFEVKELTAEAIFNTYSSYLINNDGTGPFASKEVNVIIDIDIYKYFFFNPRIISMTDEWQFRKVGLEYKVGVHITKYFDIFYAHLSHHVLEMTSQRRFNQYDGFGVQIHFIPRKDK